MRQLFSKLHKKSGFSMAEVLAVVAILAILAALATPNLVKMQRDLRQKELDAKAETIYLAVQNEMTKLRSSGNSADYYINDSENHVQPSDISIELDSDLNVVDRNIHYIFKSHGPAAYLMAEGVVDDSLAAGHWVIEYEPSGGLVYSVFYSEKANLEERYVNDGCYQLTDSSHANLRDRAERLKDGALVGYYGGDMLASSSSTTALSPTIAVTNEERLTALIRCNAPDFTTALTLRVTLSDPEGHKYEFVPSPTDPNFRHFGRSYAYNLVLDDLSKNATRFYNKYGVYGFVPGKTLTISVVVTSPDNGLLDPGFASAYTNSLFADNSTASEAHIRYARHLQNLNLADDAKVSTDISSAVLDNDIIMDESNDEKTSWYDIYSKGFFNGVYDGKPNFKPITNSYIKSFSGSDHTISGLNIHASGGNVGLFASLYGDGIDKGAGIKNLRLSGASVLGESASTGALVGRITGECTIENCRVYLAVPKYTKNENDEVDRIKGTSAGGLVGVVGANVTVSNSFASTVISGSNEAGGLIGRIDSGDVSIYGSYADSYITGYTVGGLACGSVNTVDSCYTAGFLISSGTVAGLVNGNVASMASSYSIVKPESSVGSSPVYYSTAKEIGSHDNKVYYFTGGNDVSGTQPIGEKTSAELASELGEAFETDTADSTPYNLRGQSLTMYSYPGLKAIPHFGDWQADFIPGSLVYYEKYKDDTYGFWGANANDATLNDKKTVVGDGYGVVYMKSDALPDSISVEIDGETTEISKDVYYEVEGDTTYHIYPLPKDIVNAEAEGTSFYKQAVINTSHSETVYINMHFAKMVFAQEPTVTPYVYIRTPRHLYNMSLYYDDNYRTATADSVYMQERDADYDKYDWAGFTSQSSGVGRQEPIGRTKDKSFISDYDGGCNKITNVSFVSNTGEYVGFIGYNEGTVKNVVMVTDYDPEADTHSFVQRNGSIDANETLSIGVLVGYNAQNARIENSAVAGYYVAGSDGTLHAYTDSTVYAGGLVGENAGTVINSEADSPAIRLSSLYAQVNLGGFVGMNAETGSIINSYDLGYIKVAESRGPEDSVHAAGFAGGNVGRITECYCATSIVTNGEAAASHGFASGDGSVKSCGFLDKGSYNFIDKLLDYNSSGVENKATSCTYEELETLAVFSGAKARKSLNHPNTDADVYPFRAVVTEDGKPNGRLVHYGDWITPQEMGVVGVFYWEKEEYGSNNGYHLTFIGTKFKDDGNGKKQVGGSTLCTAHDDGGVITEFGYGYYVETGKTIDKPVSVGLECGTSYNEGAKSAFHEQLPEYDFYPYTTRYATSGDFIYLNNGEKKYGTWKLSSAGQDFEYEINPFFANAMSSKVNDAGSKLLVTSSDWTRTDYMKEAGTEDNGYEIKDESKIGNAYEIRCLDQFRYINWNYKQHNCDTLVYGEEGKADVGNYKDFPFLQYATVLSQGTQTFSAVDSLRKKQYWVQTHDLKAVNEEAVSLEIVERMSDALQNAKVHRKYKKYKLQLTAEEVETLVCTLRNYTIRLAESTGVEVEPDSCNDSDAIISMEQYLSIQKQVLAKTA